MFTIFSSEMMNRNDRIKNRLDIPYRSNQNVLNSHSFCDAFKNLTLEGIIPTPPHGEIASESAKSQLQTDNLAESMEPTLKSLALDDHLSSSEKILIQYRCSIGSTRSFDEHYKLYFKTEDVSIENLIGIPGMPRSSCRILDWHGTDTKIEDTIEVGEWTQSHPFLARLNKVTCLTTKNAVKRVLEIELDLEGSHITFLPGDAFGILPKNNPQLIHALMKRLHIHDPHRLVSLLRESQTSKGNHLVAVFIISTMLIGLFRLPILRYSHLIEIRHLSNLFFFFSILYV